MASYLFCPRCHSMQFSTIYDFERDLLIIKCEKCGEMYSVTNEDYLNLGIERIFKEWHGCYWNDVKDTHAYNKALEWPSLRHTGII